MSRQIEAISSPAGEGLFGRLGGLVARRPWVVIGSWIVLAIVLILTTPTLEEVSQKHPVAILPDNAPSLVAAEKMTKAFHEDGDQSIAVVVLAKKTRG